MSRIQRKAEASGFRSSDDESAARQVKAKELVEESGAPRRQLEQPDLRGDKWHKKLEEIAARLGTGFLVAFIGGRGPGKTQMAVELIKLAAAGGMRPKYTTAMEFFIAVKGAYRDDQGTPSEALVIAQYSRPRLLVIDEVQERGATPWEDRLLTHLVDVRYREMRDTILIGNLDLESLRTEVGPSIVSRLIETGGVVQFDWPSFRSGKPAPSAVARAEVEQEASAIEKARRKK
jgi:DNA replication protein DnaC